MTEWFTEAKDAKAAAEKDRERRQRPRTQAEMDELNGIDSSRREESDNYFERTARQNQELMERQDVRSHRALVCIYIYIHEYMSTQWMRGCQMSLNNVTHAHIMCFCALFVCNVMSLDCRKTWMISVTL